MKCPGDLDPNDFLNWISIFSSIKTITTEPHGYPPGTSDPNGAGYHHPGITWGSLSHADAIILVKIPY